MFEQLRMRYVLGLLIVTGTLLGITDQTEAVVVIFPDANLETKVRSELGIPTDPITDTDMETMGTLVANSSNISNIQGLEYASNLTSLNLEYNPISDISALAGLTNMAELTLNDNQINDISAVSGLTNLTRLILGNNQIGDISVVSGLTNLTTLSLPNNQISDISVVSGLTNLKYLALNDNQISEISAVSGLTNLDTLILRYNQIETMNLSGAELSSLKYFTITSNPLTSVLLTDATLSQTVFNVLMDGGQPGGYFTGIAELPGILNLDMSRIDFSGISDLSKMYGMDDLETLSLAGATNLGGSQVTSLIFELDSLDWLDVTGPWDSFDTGTQSSLSAWDAVAGNTLVTALVMHFPDPNLEAAVRNALSIPTAPITDTDMETLGSFSANSSNISNIQGLEYGTNLTELSMYNNQISDISAVSGLTNLKTLYLHDNQISDISAVAGLTNLNMLAVGLNQITDISAATGLTNLTELYLHYNHVSDISAVAGLTNLNTLWLQYNQIGDISAVSGLTNLRYLYLNDNQIEIINLSNANVSSLEYFEIANNPLISVLLVDVTLGQAGFNALMDGGTSWYTGIAELPGVLNLDMSGVNFTDISDLSAMYEMDDLEKLLLAEATNLDGSQVVPLIFKLDSLAWLDVAGLWDSFDAFQQYTLNAWDAAEGNTLVTVSIPGDANHDGTVDEDDAAILADNWQTGSGATWAMGDFNYDGAVNGIDATLLAANWQSGASQEVPEPSAYIGLLALCLPGLFKIHGIFGPPRVSKCI